jgi:hypothetical protein
MARIILEHKGQVLKDFPLHKGSLTIGRRKDNTIVFNDPQVSALHARIDKRGTDYILTDLQSTNGTYVNNLKVFSHRLHHGDRISVSKHDLLFIGTEKAKIDAALDRVPLDRTVIVGGARQRKARPLARPTLPEPPIHQEKSSGFLRRLLFVFALVAVILVIGFWGLQDEPFSFRSIFSKDEPLDQLDQHTLPITKQLPPPQAPEPQTAEGFFETSDLESGLAIDAIVWSSDGVSSFALINGSRVTVGQSVEGFTVAEIGRDYVLLRSPDGQSTIRLTIILK